MPVVEKYASLGKAHKISAVPPPEEVFLEVEKILQPVFVEDTFSGETVAVQSASVVSNAQPTIMYSKRPSANWVSSLLCFVCYAMQRFLPPCPFMERCCTTSHNRRRWAWQERLRTHTSSHVQLLVCIAPASMTAIGLFYGLA